MGKLAEWLTANRMSYPQLQRMIAREYLAAPTVVTLSNIGIGKKQPSVELMLILVAVTRGAVQPHDFLVDIKRNYTRRGERIYQFSTETVQGKVDDLLELL